MPYIVYVYQRGATVPHMEVLPMTDREAARAAAFHVLKQHDNAMLAELWKDDDLVEELTPG